MEALVQQLVKDLSEDEAGARFTAADLLVQLESNGGLPQNLEDLREATGLKLHSRQALQAFCRVIAESRFEEPTNGLLVCDECEGEMLAIGQLLWLDGERHYFQCSGCGTRTSVPWNEI